MAVATPKTAVEVARRRVSAINAKV
jgi:hypothetical protein